MNTKFFGALGIALFLVVYIQAPCLLGANQNEQKIKKLNEIVSKIKDKKNHYYTAPMDLKNLGKETLPYLMSYVDDPDPEVRTEMVGAIAEFKKNDTSIIPLLTNKLGDKDYNVRISALNALNGFPIDALKKNISDELIKNIIKMAKDRDENSDIGILLLGNIGANVNKELKEILTRESNNPNKIENWYILKPKMVSAASKALLKLNDIDEVKSIIQYMDKGTISERVLGIECVVYAQRKDLALHIVPLLDDKNEVKNIAPSIPRLKIMNHVRDYAANALISLYDIKDIKPSDRKVFTDDEIIRLKSEIKN